jgi:murein DD-endopeptidase MepM/ murein hydrolase activator NlpD
LAPPPEPEAKPASEAPPEPELKPAPEAPAAPRTEPVAPVPRPRPRAGAGRAAFWLVLIAVILVGAGGYYGYRRYAQPPPRAKVARIPAASLPKVLPLEAGLFERYARSRDQAVLTEVTVAPGSNLSKALEEAGLNSRNNYRGVLDCLTTGADSLDMVRPGSVLKAFWAGPEREVLSRLEFHPSSGAAPMVVLPRAGEGFWRFSLASPPMNISGAGFGQVEGSLWNAGIRAGLDGGLIMAMADVLASDIDFFTGLKKGDSFEVLYSRDYLDGRPQGTPVIEMVRMENNGRLFEYYLYKSPRGHSGYYNREGQSNRKTFFATPLQYTRISSGFSMARKHPIYKVVRPHQGVDYAAPTGTPVSAVADGKVVAARWSGGFGRLVTIQHDSTYTTMYGHLSSFAPGLKEGSMVRQGDLIGRVGASGAATGPHLDFRLRKNGVFVNPIPELARQVGRRLEGADYTAFAGVVPDLQRRLSAQLALSARRPVAVETLALEPEVDFVESEAAQDL